MAQQQSIARKRNRSDETASGHDQDLERFEQELADYLQERIKPGLNRGAIPLVARSIAKEVAHWDTPNGASTDATDDEDVEAEADDDVEAEAEDDFEPGSDEDVEADEEPDEPANDEDESDFEADMRDLQSEFGEEWILSFSVQGDAAW